MGSDIYSTESNNYFASQNERSSEINLKFEQEKQLKSKEKNQDFDEGFSDRDLGEIAEETPTTGISNDQKNTTKDLRSSLPLSYSHYTSVAVTPRELGNIQVNDIMTKKN